MKMFLILLAVAVGPAFYFFRKTVRLDRVPAFWAALATAAGLSVVVLGVVAVGSLA